MTQPLGFPEQAGAGVLQDLCPDAAPDGLPIAFLSDRGGSYDIYLMAADASDERPLARTPELEIFPLWSPSGRAIVLQSVRDGNFEVYRAASDGSGPARLTHDPAWEGWASFVPPARR